MSGYQLKITIKGSTPPIWRRIIVPDRITFSDLDKVIENIFGWMGSHLYEFQFKQENIWFTQYPKSADEMHAADECIDKWVEKYPKFQYTYDFGDCWEHLILVEKKVDYEQRYPVVLKYAGPNMIEDCGGIWEFYDCIDEADPFDMKGVNAQMKMCMQFPKAKRREKSKKNELQDMAYDEYNREMKTIFQKYVEIYQKSMEQNVSALRAEIKDTVVGEIQMEDILGAYKKAELISLAKLHGFQKYSHLKKKELVAWLKTHLLEPEHMKKILRESDRKETEIFEEAVEGAGIILSGELVRESKLLCSYGAYSTSEIFLIPSDVKAQYKKICTEEFEKEREQRWRFEDYCDSALYLYGVISINKLLQIYNQFEEEKMTKEETKQRCIELIKRDERMVIVGNWLVDEMLMERDLYKAVLEAQGDLPYYIPDSREEFLEYGEKGCQEPDEYTESFLTFLQHEMGLDDAHSQMIFYEAQEEIRLNCTVEDIMDLFEVYGITVPHKKQKVLISQLKKLGNNIRTWDNKGFTAMERERLEAGQAEEAPNVLAVNSGTRIIPFSAAKKIYPNDPCPCGSGKKYKFCCGKK